MKPLFVGDILIPKNSVYTGTTGNQLIFKQEVRLRVLQRRNHVFECDVRDENPKIDVIFINESEKE